MSLHVIGRFSIITFVGTVLLACVPAPPQNFNSPGFIRRAPLPGHPGYFETIKYIDDGTKYVDPTFAFFISPDGRMCFRGVLNTDRTVFEPYNSDWCLPPTAVDKIEAIRSGGTGIPKIILWCKHANPGCINEIMYNKYRGVSNSIIVGITPPEKEKAALTNLIYLMGGDLGDSHPFEFAKAYGRVSPVPLVTRWPRARGGIP